MSNGNKLQIMRKVDLTILDQLAKAKETPQYQKIQDQYDLLDENQQVLVKYSIMGVIFGIPLFIIFISSLLYFSKLSEFETHELIINKASEVIAKKSEVDNVENSILGKNISSEGALKNRMTSLVSRGGIDPQKVIISSFNSEETAGINEITASLQFDDISAANFYSLIESLSFKDKYKIRTINMEKNPKTQLLKGKLDLIFFSKAEE